MASIGQSIKDWLIHLFNPHCSICNSCANCEYLQRLLDSERIERRRLIEMLQPKVDVENEAETNEPFKQISGYTPPRVLKQRLESEARKKYAALKAERLKGVNDVRTNGISNEVNDAEDEI